MPSRSFPSLPFLGSFLTFGLLALGGAPDAEATPVVAPPTHVADSLPAILLEPFPLYERGIMGPYTRPISTRDPEAQAYFDQGLQLFYSFAPVEAARSFHEAQKRDPDCAICYWGEALAWGPFLNGALRGENAPRAYGATQEAMRLRNRATPVEQALIEAMAVRYTPTHDAATRVSLDSLYADAMADVHARFPNDHEVGTLYAESLMILEPRRGNWDIENPSVGRIHRVLGDVLDRDRSHPGACHLYIHATESTIRPDLAEACADLLTHTVPGASHMNHMPSHTYNRVGRWGDATPVEPRGLALGPAGGARGGVRHLSHPQPPYAPLLRLLRRPGGHRHPGREGLREAGAGRGILPGPDEAPLRSPG